MINQKLNIVIDICKKLGEMMGKNLSSNLGEGKLLCYESSQGVGAGGGEGKNWQICVKKNQCDINVTL